MNNGTAALNRTREEVEAEVEAEAAYDGMFVLVNYIQPVMISLGIVGNLLNLLVLQRRLRQPARSASDGSGVGVGVGSGAGAGSKKGAMFLLLCMSLTDASLLLVQVPGFVSFARLAHYFYYRCYVQMYCTNVGFTTVALLSTAVTLDRFAAARNVRALRRFFSRHTGHVVGGVVLFSVGICVPNVFYYRVPTDWQSENQCEQTVFFIKTWKTTSIVISLTNSIVPMAVMLLFGGATYRALVLKRKNMQRRFKANAHANLNASVSGSVHANVRNAHAISFATHMVLATIFIFSLCSTLSVFIVICAVADDFRVYNTDWGIALIHACNFLNFAKSSINFVLYCSTSNEYRASLINILAFSCSCSCSCPCPKHNTAARCPCPCPCPCRCGCGCGCGPCSRSPTVSL